MADVVTFGVVTVVLYVVSGLPIWLVFLLGIVLSFGGGTLTARAVRWTWVHATAGNRRRDEAIKLLSERILFLEGSGTTNRPRLPIPDPVDFLGIKWRFEPTWGQAIPICPEHGVDLSYELIPLLDPRDLRAEMVIPATDSDKEVGYLYCPGVHDGAEGHEMRFDREMSIDASRSQALNLLQAVRRKAVASR